MPFHLPYPSPLTLPPTLFLHLKLDEMMQRGEKSETEMSEISQEIELRGERV